MHFLEEKSLYLTPSPCGPIAPVRGAGSALQPPDVPFVDCGFNFSLTRSSPGDRPYDGLVVRPRHRASLRSVEGVKVPPGLRPCSLIGIMS